MSRDLPRRIGFWGGSAIMVGVIIGSGIFRTPSSIAREMGSPATILALWTAGGVLSLFGALAVAELAAMFPRSGGIYVYLNEGFGPRAAFVFGWTYMLLIKPFAAAGIAIVFAEHFHALFGLPGYPPVAAAVMIVLLTAINTVTLRGSTVVAMALTALKVLALASIVGLGVGLMKGSVANFAPEPPRKDFLSALAPVLYWILWTYDGWADVAAVAGEVEEPQRRLPLILLAGTAATVLIYVAVNVVYIALVPLSQMRGLDMVAPTVMERLIGKAGSVAVTAMIVVSTLGASHGSILTGARVTFAQAQDGLLFRFLGRVHPKHETPHVSLWIQAALSVAAVAYIQGFEDLSEGYGFMMWIFYGLAAGAVVALRVQRPDLARPYRCWGYPWIPIVFMGVALGMTILDILKAPGKTLPWLGILVLGIPAYSLWKWRSNVVDRKMSDG